MSDLPGQFLRRLHLAAVAAEDAVDIARRRLWRRLGTHQPRQIAAYHGFADAESVQVSGRVLANRPGGGPLDDDGWWENLVQTYRRWESDEIPGVPVTVRFQNNERTVVTDEEGYYHADFPPAPHAGGGLRWLTASARAASADGEIHAIHEILAPGPDAAFGIISDLDDTVIHTGIASILLAAKLTFLENAKTRKPLDGVAKLYAAFQRGLAGAPVNPIFYISSSPWNLHDLLADFLRLNDIPAGPLLLRDIGLDRTKFIKEKGHGHKRDKALRLLDAYPELPFILIGDSGQEDPAIYAELTRLRPGRIRAIYIRDVDPDADTARDAAVRRAMEDAAAAGVPLISARDSLAISEHARGLGLIPAAALPEVAAEVAADQSRPEPGEQALRDAVDSATGGGD